LDLGPLAWVALVPLLFAIWDVHPGQAFRLGYVSGFVAFFGILAWIRVFGLPAWILLVAYLALFVAAFCGIYRWVAADRSPAVRLWLVPVVWVSLEYVRSSGPMGFPWATLAVSQHALLPVIQLGSITGLFGISCLVALGNAVAVTLGLRRGRAVLVPALVIVAVLGWSVPRAPAYPSGQLRAVAVQPNVPQREKFEPTLAARNIDGLTRLVDVASRYHPDLIVFPESAIPINLFGAGGAIARVGQWAHQSRATILATGLEGGISNIAVTVAPSGQPLSRYDKVRLVAFGEAGVRAGTRYDPLATPSGLVGVAICFESIFPEIARAQVRNGAGVLAIITNDAWFDGTSGPAQHAAHAALRAVETGRWVIRAANTGVSQVIDPSGRVTAATAAERQAVLLGELTPRRVLTFYARWGDLFAWTVMAAFLMLAVPRLWAILHAEWRQPAFHHAAITVALPIIAVGALLQAGRVAWVWPLLLLAFLIILSFLRPPGAWGLHRRHVAQSFGAGLGVVLGLWALLALGYRAQGVPIDWPPLSALTVLVARQVGLALVVEGWLRGAAFTSVAEWKGWPAAVVGTTLLGMVLQSGLSAEALTWAMLTGIAFGVIRARTGNMSGLVIPHALGNVLLGVVAAVR